MDKKLFATAGGQAPADIVVKNGKLVNVYTKEIYEGGVISEEHTSELHSP